jgi:DNA-binding CsgD family transcriptional regulator
VQIQTMQDFSHTLLEIYEAAEHLSLNEYPQALMRALQRLIGFDGGMLTYCNISACDFAPERAHVYQRPTSLPFDYAPLLRQDPVAGHLLHGASVPIACDCESFYRNNALFALDLLYRRYRIAHMLLCGELPHHDGQCRWVALYRSDRHPFNETESHCLRLLCPHLMRAIANNRRQYLEQLIAATEHRAAALMRMDGWIEAEDPAFRPAMVQEWPDFAGMRMPAPVVQCWRAGGTYIGDHIRISLRSHGEHALCNAIIAPAADTLTRAERVVAYQFASGLSCPRIAEKLGVSQNTVRSHLAHIYEKLDVHDKAELANVLVLASGATHTLQSNDNALT